MTTLVTNAVILPMTAVDDDARKYFTGSVAMRDGRIVLVADNTCPDGVRRVEEFRTAAMATGGLKEIDGRGKLVMPGLVNTHTHAAMTLVRNFADDLPLMEWLGERIWPFEALLGEEEIALGAQLGIAEMLLGGTTSFVDMYWHEAAVARAIRRMGVRAVLCPCFVDGPRMEEFERDLPRTLEAAAGCGRLSVRVAPHAAYSCSPQNLRRGIDLARVNDLGMHIHLSETLDEVRIIRERYGLTPAEYLRDAGLFERPTIAAHCVHVTEGDIEILRSCGVTAAHNPQSNMKLVSGAAPVARMLRAEVNVSLGTDGASSNNDLDMWDEMRSASFLGKLTAGNPASMPAYRVLQMATVNGARAIGMEGSLGIIAEGALADVIVLDIEKPHWYPHADLVAGLVYSAKSTDVEMVFVDGCALVEGGRVVGSDTGALMRDVQQATEEIRRKLARAKVGAPARN